MTTTDIPLAGPGEPFEIVEDDVLGERMAVYRNRPRSLREVLVGSAARGDAEYVVCGDERLTYADHLARVAAFAAALRDDFGVAKGDRVAILAANCPEWIVAFWATVSLGAICTSMNAWWADPELEYALGHSEPTVVVGDAERLARVRAVAPDAPFATIETGEEFAALVAKHAGAALSDVDLAEDDPAVLLYTSGTTGRSKGALASHRAVCGMISTSMHGGAMGMLAAGPNAPAPGPNVALVTVPLFHASGLYGFVVLQLTTGGKVVLRRGRFDPDDVLRLIEEERVTAWSALGSMGPRVAERALASGRDTSSLRVLAVGGAPVSPAQQDMLREAFPHAQNAVSMGYTSSEAVGMVTRIGGEEMRANPTSAGRVVPTVQMEIRGPDGTPVPEGVDGEIHVRSPYLMLGYWRDQEATDAVLLPGRWLAMGDIGALRGGLLHINSRARDMILVNAENVFPTEVEFRLDEHPAVRECAVIGVDDVMTGQAVCAVVVPASGATVTEDDLRAWCREGMAGYKVPTQWVFRAEPLPRNPSGKVLKRELQVEVDGA
ncbi:MAG: class I adenylate-forming enzyme family protein [Acidimicrobiia bacterium]